MILLYTLLPRPSPPPTGPFFTGSIPLPMLSTEIYADAVARRWTVTDVEIDPANYVKADGSTAIVAAWFEIKVVDSSGASDYVSLGADVWELIDDADVVRATVTTDGLTVRSAVRYRVPFSIDLTQKRTYRLRNGIINYYQYTNDCQVTLDVENAYRVKLPVAMLVSGDTSTGTAGYQASEADDNLSVCCLVNSDLSYAAGSVEYYGGDGQIYWVGKFLKDASKFATIESWEFEHIACQLAYFGQPMGHASSNGFVALFNATKSLLVAGTELTHIPGVRRLTATFANNAANFDDLDEFEPRFKVQDDTETLGPARAIVYVTLTAATKALYIAGRVCNGLEFPFGGVPELDTTPGRYYHDASKFPDSTKFYYELTGHQKGNNTPVSQLNDAGTDDWGYQSTDGVPSAAAAISGSWSNASNAADDGKEGGPLVDTSAKFESAVSGAIAQLQLSGFSFSPSIPPGATIQLVVFILRYNLEGQVAPFAVSVNGHAFHSVNGTVGTSLIQGIVYDASADASWVPADFSAPTVDIKCTHPANTTNTTWWINGGELIVGWSDLLTPSQLNFTSTVRTRQRSGELTLTDGHRYTVINPGSNTSTNKILHSNGVILAEVDVSS